MVAFLCVVVKFSRAQCAPLPQKAVSLSRLSALQVIINLERQKGRCDPIYSYELHFQVAPSPSAQREFQA